MHGYFIFTSAKLFWLWQEFSTIKGSYLTKKVTIAGNSSLNSLSQLMVQIDRGVYDTRRCNQLLLISLLVYENIII